MMASREQDDKARKTSFWKCRHTYGDEQGAKNAQDVPKDGAGHAIA